MIDKAFLRKVLLDYRRMMTEAEFQQRNDDLCRQVLEYIRSKNVKTVHAFLPMVRNREFDVRPILPELRQAGVSVMVPKTDFRLRQMDHYFLEKDTVLKENKLDIPEPVNGEKADVHQADLVLVPLVAGDKKGNRIGYGGGFYDRLLDGFNRPSLGICLTTLLDELGTDPWDVPVTTMLFFKAR